jgi:hypothetical protein
MTPTYIRRVDKVNTSRSQKREEKSFSEASKSITKYNIWGKYELHTTLSFDSRNGLLLIPLQSTPC